MSREMIRNRLFFIGLILESSDRGCKLVSFLSVSASLIDEFVPGQMITGTGADIIFKIPVMRQIMAWIGTMPAKRKNITKTFEKGINVNANSVLIIL